MFDLWLSDRPWFPIFRFNSFRSHPEQNYFECEIGFEISDNLEIAPLFCNYRVIAKSFLNSKWLDHFEDIGVGSPYRICQQSADMFFFCLVVLLVGKGYGNRIYCPGSR
jgi:hypothetical protein